MTKLCTIFLFTLLLLGCEKQPTIQPPNLRLIYGEARSDITLRDIFAASAMSKFANISTDSWDQASAKRAYDIADALLYERARRKP